MIGRGVLWVSQCAKSEIGGNVRCEAGNDFAKILEKCCQSIVRGEYLKGCDVIGSKNIALDSSNFVR